MKSLAQLRLSGESRARKKCFICCKQSKEKCVLNPAQSSYEILSETISSLTNLKDDEVVQISLSLKNDVSVENLKTLGIIWHLTCYKRITNKRRRELAEKKFELTNNKNDIPEEPAACCPSQGHFTRGKNEQLYDKNAYFFL